MPRRQELALRLQQADRAARAPRLQGPEGGARLCQGGTRVDVREHGLRERGQEARGALRADGAEGDGLLPDGDGQGHQVCRRPQVQDPLRRRLAPVEGEERPRTSPTRSGPRPPADAPSRSPAARAREPGGGASSPATSRVPFVAPAAHARRSTPGMARLDSRDAAAPAAGGRRADGRRSQEAGDQVGGGRHHRAGRGRGALLDVGLLCVGQEPRGRVRRHDRRRFGHGPLPKAARDGRDRRGHRHPRLLGQGRQAPHVDAVEAAVRHCQELSGLARLPALESSEGLLERGGPV